MMTSILFFDTLEKLLPTSVNLDIECRFRIQSLYCFMCLCIQYLCYWRCLSDSESLKKLRFFILFGVSKYDSLPSFIPWEMLLPVVYFILKLESTLTRAKNELKSYEIKQFEGLYLYFRLYYMYNYMYILFPCIDYTRIFLKLA